MNYERTLTTGSFTIARRAITFVPPRRFSKILISLLIFFFLTGWKMKHKDDNQFQTNLCSILLLNLLNIYLQVVRRLHYLTWVLYHTNCCTFIQTEASLTSTHYALLFCCSCDSSTNLESDFVKCNVLPFTGWKTDNMYLFRFSSNIKTSLLLPRFCS